MIVTTTASIEGRRIGNALVGIDIDHEVVGHGGSMMMVAVSGAAVVLEPA